MLPVLILVAVGFALYRYMNRSRTLPDAPEIGAVGWASGIEWRAAPALALFEARRLATHPAFLVGIALSPLMLLLATADLSETDPWRSAGPAIALALVPMGWLVIVATHMLTTKPARAGVEMLFASLPAPRPVRTLAALASAWVAAVAAAVLATGWAVWISQRGDGLGGSIQASEVAAGVLIVAGAVCVGVATARFLPHPAFAGVAAFATGFIQVRFFEVDSWPWNGPQASPARFLGFLAETTYVDAALELRPSGWHLVYLAGLVTMMGCVALSRDGVPRALGAVLAASLLVSGVAGWMQTRPPSAAQVMRMVSHLEEPEHRYVCEVRDAMRICAFEDEPKKIAEWRRTVGSVLALVPPAVAARPLEVLPRPPTIVGNADCAPTPYTASLPPPVASRVVPERVWPADGKLHPGTNSFPCSDRSAHGLFLAVQVGAWAVGLPPAPHGRDVRCKADSQARSVLAIWLGVTSTQKGVALFDDVLADHVGPYLDFAGWDDPPMWGVTFSTSDAELAAMIARRPVANAQKVVFENWSTLTASTTPASTFAALLGIPVPGQPLTKAATCA